MRSAGIALFVSVTWGGFAAAALAGTSTPTATREQVHQPCPAPADLENTDLFGRWSLQLEAQGRSILTSLTLERNPDFAQSLAGLFSLDGQVMQVYGDIEMGRLDLEESANSKDISAIWTGQVTQAGCGQAIMGTRRDLNSNQEHPFLLRRPGW